MECSCITRLAIHKGAYISGQICSICLQFRVIHLMEVGAADQHHKREERVKWMTNCLPSLNRWMSWTTSSETNDTYPAVLVFL